MLTLKFRDSLFGKLGQTIADELDSVISQFQGLWRSEHTESGTHADVHATGAESSGFLRITGSAELTLDSTISPTWDNLIVPNLGRLTTVRITPLGEVTLSGLNANTNHIGDLVVLVNQTADIDSVVLSCHDSGSIPPNRFFGNLATSPELVYIHPGRAVWLLYDTNLDGPPGWRIFKTENS